MIEEERLSALVTSILVNIERHSTQGADGPGRVITTDMAQAQVCALRDTIIAEKL